MRYSGSKYRFRKTLNSIILKNIKPSQYYVELFCGGCNMLSYVKHPKKIAVDSNEYVIEMWQGLQNKTFSPPSSLSAKKYSEIRKDFNEKTNIYPKSLIGYVGNACSYGGKWWGGYAHFNPNKNNGKGEDHILGASNGLKNQVKNFKYFESTLFVCGSYDEIELPPNSVLYLDPPYASTTGYKDDFDSEKFWEWCRKTHEKGHEIYVSEYSAPEDFICVWEQEKKDGMRTTNKGITQKTKIEKLFTLNK